MSGGRDLHPAGKGRPGTCAWQREGVVASGQPWTPPCALDTLSAASTTRLGRHRPCPACRGPRALGGRRHVDRAQAPGLATCCMGARCMMPAQIKEQEMLISRRRWERNFPTARFFPLCHFTNHFLCRTTVQRMFAGQSDWCPRRLTGTAMTTALKLTC